MKRELARPDSAGPNMIRFFIPTILALIIVIIVVAIYEINSSYKRISHYQEEDGAYVCTACNLSKVRRLDLSKNRISAFVVINKSEENFVHSYISNNSFLELRISNCSFLEVRISNCSFLELSFVSNSTFGGAFLHAGRLNFLSSSPVKHLNSIRKNILLATEDFYVGSIYVIPKEQKKLTCTYRHRPLSVKNFYAGEIYSKSRLLTKLYQNQRLQHTTDNFQKPHISSGLFHRELIRLFNSSEGGVLCYKPGELDNTVNLGDTIAEVNPTGVCIHKDIHLCCQNFLSGTIYSIPKEPTKFDQVERLRHITDNFPELHISFDLCDIEPCPLDSWVRWSTVLSQIKVQAENSYWKLFILAQVLCVTLLVHIISKIICQSKGELFKNQDSHYYSIIAYIG